MVTVSKELIWRTKQMSSAMKIYSYRAELGYDTDIETRDSEKTTFMTHLQVEDEVEVDLDLSVKPPASPSTCASSTTDSNYSMLLLTRSRLLRYTVLGFSFLYVLALWLVLNTPSALKTSSTNAAPPRSPIAISRP